MVAAIAEFFAQFVGQIIFESALYFRAMRWLIAGAILLALWAFGGLATGAGWVVAGVSLLFLFITEAAVGHNRQR